MQQALPSPIPGLLSGEFRPRALASLPADALAALCGLHASAFMASYLAGTPHCLNPGVRRRVAVLASEAVRRVSDAGTPVGELALLAPALRDLRRTGVTRDPAPLLAADTRLASAVLEARAAGAPLDWRAEHAALRALRSAPLTQVVWDADAPGQRHYAFTMGGGFLTGILRAWAAALRPDTASAGRPPASHWPGIGAPEAYSRLRLIGEDFGSEPLLDNRRATREAYRHYARRAERTPEELFLRYRACAVRWDGGPGPAARRRFAARARAMLAAGTGPSLAERLLLLRVVAEAEDDAGESLPF